MQTVGHVILNIALLAGEGAPTAAIGLGAVLPDLPIAALYATQRLQGRSADEIWAVHYQRPGWLAVIHGAHSIPLGLLGLTLCLALHAPFGAALFASVVCHALADLPVHARDAHRHFLPLSNYRFESPLSYWDPRFHAREVVTAEAGLVLFASLTLVARGAPLVAIVALVLVNGWYAAQVRRYWSAGGA